MLVLTLRPGETLLAEGEFELTFLRNRLDGYPQFLLTVAHDRTYVVGMVSGPLSAANAYRHEPVEFTGAYGGYVRVGDTIVKFEPKARHRIRMVIDAPERVRLSRPQQHGGSLVAR